MAAIDAAIASKGENSGKLRVLVADDNADMRDYIVRLLSTTCEVEAVADGRSPKRMPAGLRLFERAE